MAVVLLVWYAVMATGFHVHIHYCCGKVADVSINRIAETCSGHCSASKAHLEKDAEHLGCCAKRAASARQCDTHHPSTDGPELGKHCCSSDDFYVALEDAHDKPLGDELVVLLPAANAHHPVHQPITLTTAKAEQGPIRAGLALFALYEQRLFYNA